MIGRTVSHYRVTAALGAGGMGEVYRATDTKLGREVAIKVLPSEVAGDPERLARFRREAQVLAALNHPNVAAIHGLDEADGAPFLALELVPGEDLSLRLKRGPLSVEESLDVATQVADALAAAHEKGIVHRDLKPANVKLTPEGRAKVLDFGLAKAWSGEAAGSAPSSDLSQSPTLAHTGTAAGIILGTAAYMSPEQASGRPADRRCDVWAFGALLFEMLTAQRAFAGENVSEILAAVLKDEPAWEKLPAEAPPSLRRLLGRCLRKKPRERLQDVGDARLELEEARRELAAPRAEARRARAGDTRLAWTVAGALGVLAVALGAGWSLARRSPAGVMNLSVPLSPTRLAGRFCVSPDGTRVAFLGENDAGESLLQVRALDQPAARALAGTSDALAPFFSPDGEWIAYSNLVSALRKVPANGGPVVTLAEGNFRDSRGTWSDDGWIYLTQPTTERPGQLLRVRSDGGPLEPVPLRDEDARQIVREVKALPGGRVLLLTLGDLTTPDDLALVAHSLETGERHVLVAGAALTGALASGHVVYLQAGRPMAGRLDASGTRLVGSPLPLQGVAGDVPLEAADVSSQGTLLFTGAAPESQRGRLVRVARDGRVTPFGVDGEAEDPRLSSDGTRLAIGRQQDVWVLALDRRTLTRLSAAAGEDETAAFSPDGRFVAWAASRPGEPRALYRRRADGSGGEERLWSDERHFHVGSWTPHGIVVTASGRSSGWDVLLVDPQRPGSVTPLLNGRFDETGARVSPDGRLLAYVSNESGRVEVYVQSFPEPGARVQVSIDGGLQPVWRPGTRELVFRGSGKLMSATLGSGDPPDASPPRALLDDLFPGIADPDHTQFAVAADGSVIAVERGQAVERELRIAIGWTRALGLDR